MIVLGSPPPLNPSMMATSKSGPDKSFLASSCDVIVQYHAKKMAPEGAYLTQHTHKEHSTSLLLSISHDFLNQQPLKFAFPAIIRSRGLQQWYLPFGITLICDCIASVIIYSQFFQGHLMLLQQLIGFPLFFTITSVIQPP